MRQPLGVAYARILWRHSPKPETPNLEPNTLHFQNLNLTANMETLNRKLAAALNLKANNPQDKALSKTRRPSMPTINSTFHSNYNQKSLSSVSSIFKTLCPRSLKPSTPSYLSLMPLNSMMLPPTANIPKPLNTEPQCCKVSGLLA